MNKLLSLFSLVRCSLKHFLINSKQRNFSLTHLDLDLSLHLLSSSSLCFPLGIYTLLCSSLQLCSRLPHSFFLQQGIFSAIWAKVLQLGWSELNIGLFGWAAGEVDVLQLKPQDAVGYKGNLTMFFLSFFSVFCHSPLIPHPVTTLPLCTVLPRPAGLLAPTSASSQKEVIGRVLHYAGERCASSRWRRKKIMLPIPVFSPSHCWWMALRSHLGRTIPALVKRMEWTEVETEPEVQGVWAIPTMARLGPRVSGHLVLFGVIGI